MERKLRKYSFVISFWLTLINANASDFYNPNMVSAQVTDMFRYGEFGTSLFTGRMQQTIPIYKLEDPDFTINIALHYNAEGFKSRKHSGHVGYNWFLEAGGCITREVNGYPDELFRSRQPFHEEGMYHFITRMPNIDKNEVFELPNDTLGTYCYAGNFSVHMVGNNCYYDVDYEPDIFRFDFLGYKGSFMINNEGIVRIISGDYVEVDLSGILEDESFQVPANDMLPCPENENSAISIKTTDGYTYIFGGDFSKLEYTIDTYQDGNGIKSFFPYTNGVYVYRPNISSWYLAKIIAPNGRTVTFNYMPPKEGTLPETEPYADSPLWEFNENYNRLAPYHNGLDYIYNHTPSQGGCVDASYFPAGSGSYYTRSATKTCRIESIDVSGEQPLRIVFDNVQENLRMYAQSGYYGNNSYLGVSKNNYQLNAVRVLSSGRTIKTVNLSYVYKSYIGTSYTGEYSFNWRFLNSVSISGIGTYYMEYYDGVFPDLQSLSASSSSNQLTENSEMDEYGYYVGGTPSMALLKKLTYPTGGWQTYEYEAYTYNKKRKYEVVTGDALQMSEVGESGNKRGARIKKVQTYDGNNNPVETKTYTYSEGVYFDNLKVYNYFENFEDDGWAIVFRANYGMLDTHIGYGKVTEEVTNNQGTYNTIYKFDMGERTYSSLNDSNIIGRYYCDNHKFGIMSGNILYNSKLRKWGKLITIENYTSNGQLLRSTNYLYNNMPDCQTPICLDTIVTYSHYLFSDVSKKLYIYPDVLVRENIMDYNQADSLVRTKSYRYDNKLRVKEETSEDSRGVTHFTKYTYPDEIVDTYPGAYYLLTNARRVGRPIETISGHIVDGHEYVTGGTIEVYANNAFELHGGLHYRPYLREKWELSLTEPITNYQPLGKSNGSLVFDEHYTLSAEYHFDLMNRLTRIMPFGKMSTVYTWDGIYPTSKAIGNQTWTYTHIPHVGINSITDSRGITTYYTYDAEGRLIEEYLLVNGTKQILNAYHYHIKTE